MIVLGHRGCHDGTCTENTMEAFHSALSHGADGIELDLRISKEGELVVVHDANLHRVAGDAHRIQELTADELAAIPLRHGGHIPTLHDVTSAIHAPAQLDIEIKSRESVAPLIAKLKTSAALRERVIVSSFQRSILQHIHRDLPSVRTMLLVVRWPLPLRGRKLWAGIAELHPWAVAFPLLVLNHRRVRYLKHHGMRVGGWDQRGTVREARHARRIGVDIAIVKHVAEAREAGV